MLKRSLGSSYLGYQEILRLTASLRQEGKNYGRSIGWQLKISCKGKALLYPAPPVRSFRVSLAVLARERDVLLKSSLPPERKIELRSARKFPEGYPLRILVAGVDDTGPIRLIIETLREMRP